jgi:O-antigen/teichoic acid export membrane protein
VNQFVDAAICFVRLRVRFPHVFRGGAGAFACRKQFTAGLWVSISQIAQVLIYGTDVAVVGRFFGAAAVVPYNCTGKLISVLANQPQHIIRAAEPGLSQMRVRETRQRLHSVTNALNLAMLLASGLVAAVTLATNAGFVRWWVGGQFYGGLALTVLFALSMSLRHLNLTATYTLFALGHERMLALTSLTDGVLSTVFSIFLAWRMHSAVGIVLGSIASTACVLFFGNGRVLARELGVPLRELARPLGGWAWRMLLAGAGGCLLGRIIPNFFLAGAIAAIAYTALMIPVALESALRPYLLPYLAFLRFRPAESHG